MTNPGKWKKQTRKGPSPALPVKTTGGSGMRWIVLGLGLILATGGSWAFTEFVIWNRLPSNLVGRWEVVEGPPEFKEAEFQFYRSGKMVGHVNDHGMDRPMYAEVRVEEDKLYITTRHPKTGEELVSVQIIRKLDEREFVTADERGVVTRMARMRD